MDHKGPAGRLEGAIAGRTGTRCPSTTAGSPLILPTIRTAEPPGETRPSCGGGSRVLDVVEGGHGGAAVVDRQRLEAGDRLRDERLEGRIGHMEAGVADDDRDVLERRGVAADSKTAYALADSVWASRVAVGIVGADPAHGPG